ncbi:MAG: membrane dipeptidase [Halieaceae bacterium]
MKRIIVGLVVLGAVGFFGVLPGYLDRSSNRVDVGDVALALTPAAEELHQELLIADLHADPLLWRRDLLKRLDHGHTDIPRLQAGNVALQVFGSVSKTPYGQNYDANPSDSDVITALVIANGQPLATWGSLYERSLYHAQKLELLQQRSPQDLQIVRSRSDLALVLQSRAAGSQVVGGLLALEGAQPLEGDLDKLDGLFAAGYRMIGLAHFFDNAVAGSMHGMDKYGLTNFGRAVVARAEELGMIIDLAHSSPAAVTEILDMVTRPVVFSHGGVKATCDFNRNLDDEQIRRIAIIGGVIGIGYWDAAVCDTSPAGIVAAMNHVRELVGIDHIGLGSDFDGGTTTRFDTSELAYITQALMDAGYSETEIRAVMGENVLRLLRMSLP